MASSPRSAEGRRRRLAERGSDRMALITGQIQSLPPSPPPPPPPPTPTLRVSSPRFQLPPRHVRPESLPVELSQKFHPDDKISHSFSLRGSEEVKDGSKLARLRHQSGFKMSRMDHFGIRRDGESLIQDSDNNDAEATRHQVPMDDDAGIKSSSDTITSLNAATAVADKDNSDASGASDILNAQGGVKFSKRSNFQIRTKVKPLTQDSDTNSLNAETKELVAVKPSSGASRTQNTASDGTRKLPKPVNFNPTLLSSREINSSILASETLRAFCAMVIAVIVVLCYMISEKIVAIKPLYIILFNDIMIVLARVYIEKITTSEEEEGGGERVEAKTEHGHDWNGVKLLERGLVAYQAIRGVFIDCSVYYVIVISCVSLMN